MGGIAAVVFGCIWTVMAIGVTSAAPDFGPFAIAKIGFPLFGIAFIALGIFTAMKNQRQAKEYKQARARYQRRRQELLRS